MRFIAKNVLTNFPFQDGAMIKQIFSTSWYTHKTHVYRSVLSGYTLIRFEYMVFYMPFKHVVYRKLLFVELFKCTIVNQLSSVKLLMKYNIRFVLSGRPHKIRLNHDSLKALLTHLWAHLYYSVWVLSEALAVFFSRGHKNLR